MFEELLRIFRGDDPMQSLAQKFAAMMKIAEDMALHAGRIYFGEVDEPEERTRLYTQDVRVNKLERAIRKEVATHLTLSGNALDAPYCLLLMSLVKDVERLGDYAKNLAELRDLRPGDFPDDDMVKELREIRSWVEGTLTQAVDVFEHSDRERANDLIRQGRSVAQRCERLVARVARSDYDAATTTVVVLGARFYKRIGGHILNVLSSVVMPLHKVDYYDEDFVEDKGPRGDPRA